MERFLEIRREKVIRVQCYIGTMKFKFLLPIIAEFLIILTLLFFLDTVDFVHVTKVMGLYFVPVTGKESIIPLGVVHYNLHPLLVGVAIAQIDVVTAVFMHHNFEYSKNIPYMGDWIRKFEKKNTEYFNKRRFLRRLAFLLTVLFVIFPSRGSGGIAGYIFGKTLGLSGKNVLIAITVGTLTGCVGMAYFSDYISSFIPFYTLFGFISLIVIWKVIKLIKGRLS